MTSCSPVRTALAVVLVIVGLGWPAAARAQSSVGGGPLTSTLPDTEPVTGVLRLGPIRFAPGITVREIGWDSNVFDEPPEEGPVDDFVVSIMPDVSAYARLRFARISAYAGSDMTYFQTYDSENSIGYAVRGRVDFLLSRLRPFIGAGETETRTRPNGEIDVRADRRDEEVSGGLAFDISDYSLVYGSAIRTYYTYKDAFEDNVDLGETLTRNAYNYQAGLKTDITPLLSLQLFGSYLEDRFVSSPQRDSESFMGTALFRFAPEGAVSGVVSASYRDQTFVDPELKPFRGFVGTAALTYPFLEIGRFNFFLSRGFEYSFDTADAYYVERTASLSYTHLLFGNVDAQIRGSYSLFDYDARETQPAHTDTLDLLGGSVGYNLRNRTRIALNYENARRRSPAFSDRNYERRRVYLSWMFAF